MNLKFRILSLILSFVFFCLTDISYGQHVEADSLHFTGRVYDADSLTCIPYVNYKFGNSGSVCDETGSFSFWGRGGDTIVFSHISYKQGIWIVPDSIYDPDLLVGVFLSRDTILVNEVIVFPRLPDLKSLALKPVEQNKDIRNARNNLDILAYQAGHTRPETWDSEMNQKYVLDNYRMQAMNKGLISPDEILPITAVIPLAIALIRQKYQSDNKEDLKIKPNEEDLLIGLYKRDKK